MKSYLNRQECTDWVTSITACDYILDMVERWGGNLSTDERRQFRTACTNIKKAGESIIHRMPVEMIIKLKRTADQYGLSMIPKHSSKAFHESVEQEMKAEGVWCSEELLCLLADKALQKCCCPCSVDDVENCPLKFAFTGLDIPMFCEEPEEGRCPYEIR